MKNLSFVFFLSFFSVFLLISCKKSIEPYLKTDVPDTTSHDFIWRIDTIGWRNTELFDVSIINEHDIWVSGYITKKNSDIVYSAAHWTGTNWKLVRFKTDLPYTSYIYNATGIWSISDDDIWLASGSIFHWDGNLAKLSWYVTKVSKHIWYNNSYDIWATGKDGLILHYDGHEWKILDSETSTPVIDIWGHINSKNKKRLVLATISCDWWNTEGDYRIVSLHNNYLVDTLQWKWPKERPLMSIWWDDNSPIYVVGGGIAFFDTTWHTVNNIPNYGLYKIRGSAWNNIFAVGSYGTILHYNGVNWHYYNELIFDGAIKSVAVKDEYVVAVGYIGSFRPYGIILVGKMRRY